MTDSKYGNLLHELKIGNQKAFDIIFRDHYALLCYEARGYFRDNFLVEEIVCDVFTRLWQGRTSINLTGALKDYLVKAVHNTCIDYYRKQKTQEKLKHDVSEDQRRTYSLADLVQNPLDYTIVNELKQKLQQAIDTLPPRYKEAFLLSRNRDMTYEEIALEMGISVNGVKLYIKKALSHLRKELSDYWISGAILVFLLLKKFF